MVWRYHPRLPPGSYQPTKHFQQLKIVMDTPKHKILAISVVETSHQRSEPEENEITFVNFIIVIIARWKQKSVFLMISAAKRYQGGWLSRCLHGARPQFSVRYMKHYLCNLSSFLNSHQKASVSTEALNSDILIKPVSVLEAHTEVSFQHHVYSVTRSF